MSFFEKVELLPADPILNLPILFAADPRTNKVNLGIGAYKDENGKPFLLSSVKKAEDLVYSKALNKEYQPIEGNPSYIQETINLIFGNNLSFDQISAVQSIGGTGALRLGAEFLIDHKHSEIFLPNPSWINHTNIFKKAGMTLKEYPYYDYSTGGLKFETMLQVFHTMSSGSVILLHAGCHNPTGADFSQDQWKIVSEVLKKKRIIPFFDLAYQGFGKSLKDDAWPIRYFVSQKHELFVAYSFSKNLGLYGERMGALCWYMSSKEIAIHILSQIKQIVRGMYSSPPLHGGRLIATILQSDALKEEWSKELEQMRLRMEEMRQLLTKRLNAKKLHKDFNYVQNQRGMFSLSGLTPQQVERLRKEYGIYMLTNGRISIPGLTHSNVDYVADSISEVLT